MYEPSRKSIALGIFLSVVSPIKALAEHTFEGCDKTKYTIEKVYSNGMRFTQSVQDGSNIVEEEYLVIDEDGLEGVEYIVYKAIIWDESDPSIKQTLAFSGRVKDGRFNINSIHPEGIYFPQDSLCQQTLETVLVHEEVKGIYEEIINCNLPYINQGLAERIRHTSRLTLVPK